MPPDDMSHSMSYLYGSSSKNALDKHQGMDTFQLALFFFRKRC